MSTQNYILIIGAAIVFGLIVYFLGWRQRNRQDVVLSDPLPTVEPFKKGFPDGGYVDGVFESASDIDYMLRGKMIRPQDVSRIPPKSALVPERFPFTPVTSGRGSSLKSRTDERREHQERMDAEWERVHQDNQRREREEARLREIDFQDGPMFVLPTATDPLGLGERIPTFKFAPDFEAARVQRQFTPERGDAEMPASTPEPVRVDPPPPPAPEPAPAPSYEPPPPPAYEPPAPAPYEAPAPSDSGSSYGSSGD